LPAHQSSICVLSSAQQHSNSSKAAISAPHAGCNGPQLAARASLGIDTAVAATTQLPGS
jgi:hypothetical protein